VEKNAIRQRKEQEYPTTNGNETEQLRKMSADLVEEGQKVTV